MYLTSDYSFRSVFFNFVSKMDWVAKQKVGIQKNQLWMLNKSSAIKLVHFQDIPASGYSV